MLSYVPETMRKITMPLRLHRGSVYWIVGLTAAAVRLSVFAAARESPLSRFHLIPGLDMMTHWELGRRLASGAGVFTPFRLLVAAAGSPDRLMLLQMSCGALSSLLVTFCALRLWRNRKTALIAGVLASLYAPPLLYECTALQEPLLAFLNLLAFAVMLDAHRRRFSPASLVEAGGALGLAGTGRPSSLPFLLFALCWLSLSPRRGSPGILRRGCLLCTGLLAVWIPVVSWNWLHAKWPLPFYGGNISYIADVIQSPSLRDWNRAAPAERRARDPRAFMSRAVAGFLRKAPLMLSPREIPDNLNYHYLRQRLAPLSVLPGPLLVLPAATAGMALMAFSGRRSCGRNWLLLGCMLGMSVCAIAYYPVGRYRLILYPALILSAIYPLALMFRRTRKDFTTCGITVPVVCCASWCLMPPVPERAADAAAWAMALDRMPDPPERSIRYHLEAYARSRRNPVYLTRAITPLLKARRHAEAAAVLKSFEGDAAWRAYYTALLELASGRPEEAERLLRGIRPDDLPGMQVPHQYFLAESLRGQGRGDEAAAIARRALLRHGISRGQRSALLRLLENLERSPSSR